MKPVLGSLGANTLVILTHEEVDMIREALEDENCRSGGRVATDALNAGIARGTAHLEAEFAALQKERKRGK